MTGRILGFLMAGALLQGIQGCTEEPAPEPDSLERTMVLVRNWVDGYYDNRAQAEADLADDRIPDDQKHRLVHQLFVPLTQAVPAIPGHLVFQQSSADGSYAPESITRAGILQFLPDPTVGVVRQRELNFKDVPAWRNAHQTPDRFSTLTLDDFNVNPGCDFLLQADAAGTEVFGPMGKGSCRFFSQGLNKDLVADDAVTIRPDQYWFLGRFVDEQGAVMWGNASPEPYKLVRLPKEKSRH